MNACVLGCVVHRGTSRGLATAKEKLVKKHTTDYSKFDSLMQQQKEEEDEEEAPGDRKPFHEPSRKL